MSSHARSTLSGLPEEILAIIFNDLALSSDNDAPKATLGNISLVSKKFHRIADPILYRSYTKICPVMNLPPDFIDFGPGPLVIEDFAAGFPGAEPLEIYVPETIPSPPPPPESKSEDDSIIPFLRTLCLSPQRGELLESLTIECTGDGHVPFGAPLTATLIQWRLSAFEHIVEENAKEFSRFLSQKLTRSLMQGTEDAMIAMLLLLCPRICELTLILPDRRKSTLVETLISFADSCVSPETESILTGRLSTVQEAEQYVAAQLFGGTWPVQFLRPPHILRHLKNLTLKSSNDYFTKARSRQSQGTKFWLVPFFELPCLTTVRIHGLQSGLWKSKELIGRSFPQIRHVSLLEWNMPSANIVQLIQCLPSLLTLEVVWGSSYAELREPTLHDAIGAAISAYAPRISILTIDTSPGNAVAYSPDTQFHHSIRDLQQLTNLKVTQTAVWSDAVESGFRLNSLQSSLPRCLVDLELSCLLSPWHLDSSDSDSSVSNSSASDESAVGPDVCEWKASWAQDMCSFLQDRSYTCLRRVVFEGWVGLTGDMTAGWEVDRSVVPREGKGALRTVLHR